MKKMIGVLIAAIAVVLVVQGVGWAAYPTKMSIQGKITKDGKIPKTLSNIKVSFSDSSDVYNPERTISGANLDYSDTTGVFNAIIDFTEDANKLNSYDSKVKIKVTGTDANSAAFTNVDLGVQNLRTVPYAYRAAIADNVAALGIPWPITRSLDSASPLLTLQNTGTGVGIKGMAASNTGVYGQSTSGTGAYGKSTTGTGVSGLSENGIGVAGNSGIFGVWGNALATGNGIGVTGLSTGNGDYSMGVYGGSTTIGVAGGGSLTVNPVTYAITVQTANYGVLGLGSAAGVAGGSPTDQYHFGVLGASNPLKIEGSTTLLMGTTRAGVFGQVEGGGSYGFLGYSYKSTPTSTPVDYGVYGYGPIAARLVNSNIDKYALEILSVGKAVDIKGGSGKTIGANLVNMHNESTYSGAGGLNVITDGGGHAGNFVNNSNAIGSSHATIRAENQNADSGTAGYFYSKGTGVIIDVTKHGTFGNTSGIGIDATSAKIGDYGNAPIIKMAVWKKHLNGSGNVTFTGPAAKTPLFISVVINTPTGGWTQANPSVASYDWDTGIFTVNSSIENKDAYITFIYTEPENEPPLN